MSAILKALKKLEQERAESTGEPFPEKSGSRSPERPKSMVIPGLIVIVLCIFAGVGFSIFARKPSVPETANVILNDEKPVQVLQTPEKNENRNSTVVTGSQNQKKTAVTGERSNFSSNGTLAVVNQKAETGNTMRKAPDAEPRQLTDVSPAVPRTQSADPFSPIDISPDAAEESRHFYEMDETGETDAAQAIPNQGDTSQQETPSPILTEEAIADDQPGIRETAPTLEIIDDPAIELQAISWSADPNKRLAIINGQICREKDRVGGYVIDAINSGDVTLTRGSVSGRLVFEIR